MEKYLHCLLINQKRRIITNHPPDFLGRKPLLQPYEHLTIRRISWDENPSSRSI